jgi:hypothetical protein
VLLHAKIAIRDSLTLLIRSIRSHDLGSGDVASGEGRPRRGASDAGGVGAGTVVELIANRLA